MGTLNDIKITYIGDGNKIEQNKQIVISGFIKDKNIVENWSLTKT